MEPEENKVKSEPDSGDLKSWTEESWQVLEQERSLCFRETYFSSGSQHGLDNRKTCSLLGGGGAKHKTPLHRKAFCWALFLGLSIALMLRAFKRGRDDTLRVMQGEPNISRP